MQQSWLQAWRCMQDAMYSISDCYKARELLNTIGTGCLLTAIIFVMLCFQQQTLGLNELSGACRRSWHKAEGVRFCVSHTIWRSSRFAAPSSRCLSSFSSFTFSQSCYIWRFSVELLAGSGHVQFMVSSQHHVQPGKLQV